MRAIIQRVNSAQVIVEENTVGEIQKGYLMRTTQIKRVT